MKKVLVPASILANWVLNSNRNNLRDAWWLVGVIGMLLLSFAAPLQSLHAAGEPAPTPVIEPPSAPPLAISPASDIVEDEEERSLLLLILIIVVSSATALALGVYAYRKVRKILAKKKKAKEDAKE